MTFADRMDSYTVRVDAAMDRTLPAADRLPLRLHEAMRYATLNGGKRIRPLLVYASGEVLGVDVRHLDPPAMAIEFLHAFSLVHDDLPAMDDDDLRRGKPTVHRRYDEATAILAADALQPLAFQVLAEAPPPPAGPAAQLAVIELFTRACGSLGMTGGQAIDLESEGRRLDRDSLEHMFRLKTGRLIAASILTPPLLAVDTSDEARHALATFAECLGLAFQIRDDILDVEGETEVIGKTAGADASHDKATWPGLFGLDEAKRRCDELYAAGTAALDHFGEAAEPLRWLADFIIHRAS
ncbi:polyprenyl synthetase family protein [Lentisalinibacter salinarum]|uniref:polyprenyl synthetase family protein n=1 Tax=Lentisalinibacter salinarum TaxID=2992239 RepID=UPI0038698043